MIWGRWRYKQFHVSILLGWCCAGLLAGLFLGRGVALGLSALSALVVCALLLGGFRSRRWWAVGAVVMAGLLIGVMRSHFVQQQYDQYQGLTGKQVELQGKLSGDVQVEVSGRRKMMLAHIMIDQRRYVGEVFVTSYEKTDMKRGDTVTLRGVMREGFASYAGAVTSADIVSVSRGPNLIRDVREAFANAVRSVMVDPMASLGLGFVVGQRSTLPDTLDEQLKIVGLTHIVVASGYNLTILVRFVMRLLSRHSRYLALSVSLVVVVGFVLFSGFSPSMNRALMVTVLSLLAWYVGRRFNPILLIVYVAAATALFNPMYIWSDLGWYLSFFAFAGILVVAPLAMRQLYRRREPSSFEQLVVETMSAEVMALPLIAFTFGTLPVFGLIANVLVAPFIPAAMALTAATGVVAMASEAVGSLLAVPANILIAYMISVVEWLASSSFAEINAEISLGFVVAWYLFVALIGYRVVHRTRYDFSRRDRSLDI